MSRTREGSVSAKVEHSDQTPRFESEQVTSGAFRSITGMSQTLLWDPGPQGQLQNPRVLSSFPSAAILLEAMIQSTSESWRQRVMEEAPSLSADHVLATGLQQPSQPHTASLLPLRESADTFTGIRTSSNIIGVL